MCVEITISLGKGITTPGLLGLHGTAGAQIKLVPVDKTRSDLLVTTPGEGCTCSLLADSKDVQPTTWKLERRWIPTLASAVQRAYDKSNRGIAVSCLWFGDAIKHTETVPIKHLVSLITNNQFANWTRYIVKKRAG